MVMINELEKEIAPTEELKVKKSDYWKVPFHMLRTIEGFNIAGRSDHPDIEELALSILNSGQKTPLVCYKEGDFYVVNVGHRRYAAFDMIINKWGKTWGHINIMVEPKGYTEDERYFDLFLSNDQKNLEPLQKGELFKTIVTRGFSPKQIADKIGRKKKYVEGLIELANSPQLIKNEINEGNISASLVRDLRYEVKDDKQVLDIIQTAKENLQEEDLPDDDSLNEPLPLDELTEEPKPKKPRKITKKDIDKAEPKLKKLGAVQRLENLKEYLENSEVKGFKMSLSKLIDWLKENKSNEEFLLD